MQNNILKTALIGVGNMGRKYAEMITAGEVPHMKLTAIVIRRDELMEWGKSLVNTDGEKVKIFRSAEELFAAEAENINVNIIGNYIQKLNDKKPEKSTDNCKGNEENTNDYKNNKEDNYKIHTTSLFDAVIIATPHKTHKELALKAFALKKDVLCDKPAAADIGEALEMNEAASKSNRIYGMVFHQRLYPKYVKIKEMIDNNELGELVRVNLINSRYLRTTHYHKSGSWRSSFAGEGGGALINQGQHILDMFQYLFGMPQRIFAVIPFGKYNNFAVDDEDTIIMSYDNGMTASFVLTTGEACYEERLEVIGTKAKLLLEDNTLTITRHQDVREYIKTENVNSRENMHFTQEIIEYEKEPEPYTRLLEGFAKASLEQNSDYLVARGEEGINSLMLCAGAYYSACRGIQVELPLDADEYRKLMDELISKEQ